MNFHPLAHFLAAALPEPGVTALTAPRPQWFAAAIYPLRGNLGEHLYATLHPGGETATEAALLVSAVPGELARAVPLALSLELLMASFPVPPAGVIPDELTRYPLPFPTLVAPLVALDHGDVVARRSAAAEPQLLRAYLSTSDTVGVWP
jgi:hypothetical protein